MFVFWSNQFDILSNKEDLCCITHRQTTPHQDQGAPHSTTCHNHPLRIDSDLSGYSLIDWPTYATFSIPRHPPAHHTGCPLHVLIMFKQYSVHLEPLNKLRARLGRIRQPARRRALLFPAPAARRAVTAAMFCTAAVLWAYSRLPAELPTSFQQHVASVALHDRFSRHTHTSAYAVHARLVFGRVEELQTL